MLRRAGPLFNHYQTLGIGFRASALDIKAAYRDLAKKYHPDRNSNNPEAEKRFREVKEAYECLSNKVKRADYDKVWVMTGRVKWATEGEASKPSSTEDETPGLTRKEQAILYAIVLSIPALTALKRQNAPEVSAGDIPAGNRRAISWTEIPDLAIPTSHEDLVNAYYNPLTDRWERLDSGQPVPTPLELVSYLTREHKGLYQQILRTRSLRIPSKSDVLQTRLVPREITVEGMVSKMSVSH